MEASINDLIAKNVKDAFGLLEKALDCDVLAYFGPIKDGNENQILSIVEDLANDVNKHETLAVVLTTTGGSACAVERYVNIIRKHYKKVIFIVPDYAYSAGTIFCMSGDEIWMDYFSVLGPIDPQVFNKEGKLVPALGYLDKIKELVVKAKNRQLTDAEFIILKDFDLAELKGYEQALELTVDLLKKWLVTYKFKNWTTHKSSGKLVTEDDKKKRAEEIASALGDYTKWKSHGRPINIEELNELKLLIEDYTDRKQREDIRRYYKIALDYLSRNQYPIFVQTRLFF